METLKSYLDRTGEKQVAFAERIDTSPATISRLCAGLLKPSLDLAHLIESATDGSVRMASWVASAAGGINAASQHTGSTGQSGDVSGQQSGTLSSSRSGVGNTDKLSRESLKLQTGESHRDLLAGDSVSDFDVNDVHSINVATAKLENAARGNSNGFHSQSNVEGSKA